MQNNYLIRWKSATPDPIASKEALKDLDSQWVSLQALQSLGVNKNQVLTDALEIIQIGPKSLAGKTVYTTIGRVVNLRGRGFTVISAGKEMDQFLEDNVLVVYRNGTSEFVGLSELMNQGNDELRSVMLKNEILKIGKVGKDASGNALYDTVGRVVPTFNANNINHPNFELWSTNNINAKLTQYVQIVTKKETPIGQIAEFIAIKDLQDYKTMTKVRKVADEVNIVVVNEEKKRLDTVGHVYIDGSVDGSTVEVDVSGFR